MSGGSFSYMCYTFKDTYEGQMEDVELNELIDDLSKVLHDLEWWQSADISEDSYRKTVQKFKEKWFGSRDVELRSLIAKELDKVKNTLSVL